MHLVMGLNFTHFARLGKGLHKLQDFLPNPYCISVVIVHHVSLSIMYIVSIQLK